MRQIFVAFSEYINFIKSLEIMIFKNLGEINLFLWFQFCLDVISIIGANNFGFNSLSTVEFDKFICVHKTFTRIPA